MWYPIDPIILLQTNKPSSRERERDSKSEKNGLIKDCGFNVSQQSTKRRWTAIVKRMWSVRSTPQHSANSQRLHCSIVCQSTGQSNHLLEGVFHLFGTGNYSSIFFFEFHCLTNRKLVKRLLETISSRISATKPNQIRSITLDIISSMRWMN